MMAILGISAYYHDLAAPLVGDLPILPDRYDPTDKGGKSGISGISGKSVGVRGPIQQ